MGRTRDHNFNIQAKSGKTTGKVRDSSFLQSYKKDAIKFMYYCKPVMQEALLWYSTWWGPFILLILCYFSNIIFLFFECLSEDNKSLAMSKACSMVSSMWSSYISFWHGQTFTGLENIPETGGAVIVWYHGPMPVDYFGLIAEVFKRDGRIINTVVDKCLLKVPGLGRVRKYLRCGAFSKVQCAGLLDDGELVGLAPGGSREALFDDSYSVCWRQRVGFAKIAAFTQSPIIPVFTENIRLSYCTMLSAGAVWRTIFEVTRLPIVPIYGGFPVQVTTNIGSPIMAREGETLMLLQERVKIAMKDLIRRHQRPDVDIKTGLGQRLGKIIQGF